jgi:hypothetical protein
MTIFSPIGLGRMIIGSQSISSYQIYARNIFNPFSNKEAWKDVFLDLCSKVSFLMMYSQASFQYLLHQFTFHFSSLES